MILEWLDARSQACIEAVRRSAFLQRLGGLPRGYEGIGRAENWESVSYSHRCYRMLLRQEESSLRRLIRSAFEWFWRSSLASIGVFLLLFGAFSISGVWFYGASYVSWRFLFSAIFIFSALIVSGRPASMVYSSKA